MNRIWRAYVLSNIHISLCAVVFCWAGYVLLHVEVNLWVLLFLFSGTLCTYTLHRIISGKELQTNIKGHERFSFVRNIGKWKIVYISILIALALLCFSKLSQDLRIYIAILSALSIGYIIPVIGSDKRLRDINMLKIFLVAFVWAGIFLIPFFDSSRTINLSKFTLLFLEKFLFIFALTLPFDYRDRELDTAAHLSTLANVFSTKRTKGMIALALMACCLLLVLLYMNGTYTSYLMWSLLGFYALQAWLSLRISSETDEIYFLGILDGLILLQGLIIITQ